nr:MarC family protein [Microcystis aeruginosa]
MSYTARERKEVQRLVALFVSLTVLCLLLIFMFIGTAMLKFFGVTLDSFRLAGGVLFPHFSQRKRMECLKALPSIDLNPILAQLPQRQCVVRI